MVAPRPLKYVPVTGCISMFCWPCALAQIEDTLTSSHYVEEDLEH